MERNGLIARKALGSKDFFFNDGRYYIMFIYMGRTDDAAGESRGQMLEQTPCV